MGAVEPWQRRAGTQGCCQKGVGQMQTADSNEVEFSGFDAAFDFGKVVNGRCCPFVA